MLSAVFSIGSGVRQGGTLSPALFNLFINVIIVNLLQSGYGCRVQQIYVGCIVYADDIILLSPTVSGLQEMLRVCYASSCELRLQFNAAKRHCMAFGKFTTYDKQPLWLGPDALMWSQDY